MPSYGELSDPEYCDWSAQLWWAWNQVVQKARQSLQKANEPLQSGHITLLMDHAVIKHCLACHMGNPREEPFAEKSHMETMVSPYGLCTAGPTIQRHGLIWDELKTIRKRQPILPRVHSTLLFHLGPRWRALFLEGCSSTKMSLVCDWNQCSPLPPARKTGLQYASAEDQEEDGTAFSLCLPLFTEQLHKVGFYAIHWDRQERHLHIATASGGILVTAGATSQRGTIPRHTSGQSLSSNYFVHQLHEN